MKQRYTAILATLSNAICNSVLDYSVNRYNYIRVLLCSAGIALMLQLVWGIHIGISLNTPSLSWIIFHEIIVLLGFRKFLFCVRNVQLHQ